MQKEFKVLSNEDILMETKYYFCGSMDPINFSDDQLPLTKLISINYEEIIRFLDNSNLTFT